MNNKPTPETDAAWAAESGNGLNEVKEISRKLERERDEARDIAKNLVDYAHQCLAERKKWAAGSRRYERQMNEIRVDIARVNWEETK
tara:strand:- start:163 stop:423 length:261 start_codon:yes stop_codon:yes gene_type:complete